MKIKRSSYQSNNKKQLNKDISCKCPTCQIVPYSSEDFDLLEEEIKSIQKSISFTKKDTNKILEKVLKLEKFLTK